MVLFSLSQYTHGMEATYDLLLLSTSPPLFLSHPSLFCLSLSLFGFALQTLSLCISLYHVHYFRCSCFFTHVHTATRKWVCLYARIYVHIRTYTRAYTAWHTSLLLRCAELRRMAAIKLELMNSMGARGRQRERCEKRRLDQFYRPFVIPTGSMDTQRGL